MTDESLDELWPEIRRRIEQSKIVPLDATIAVPSRRRTWRRVAAAGAIAAGLAIIAVFTQRSAPVTVDTVAVTDSVRAYEEESRALLNRLELQRAVMRPEAAASLDRDLAVVDQAIDELRVAIATDPRNPALRQLLAQSYRQKVELLKRAGNAS